LALKTCSVKSVNGKTQSFCTGGQKLSENLPHSVVESDALRHILLCKL